MWDLDALRRLNEDRVAYFVKKREEREALNKALENQSNRYRAEKRIPADPAQ